MIKSENTRKKMHPRWLARLRAAWTSRFWLPCPICDKPFAGFESAGMLMINLSEGRGVCPDCVEEADKRNLVAMERWHRAYYERNS